MSDQKTNPEDAVLDECQCCHETIGMTQIHWTGTQMLCSKCNSEPPNESVIVTKQPAVLLAVTNGHKVIFSDTRRQWMVTSSPTTLLHVRGGKSTI